MRIAALITGTTLLLSCSSNAPAHVTIGIAIPSYVHAVAWIAADRGEFDEITGKVVVMGGSAATARALLSDSAEVGLLGGDAVIKANGAGGDLVIVAGLVNRFYHRVIGRKGLGSMDGLRGGTVGLPFLGGPQDMALRYALRSSGLVYGKDVTIRNLGREMNRMAALSRGDIDATTSQTPPRRLATLGFEVLADLPARDIPFPYLMVATRQDFLSRHPKRVRAILRGLCRAALFYRTEQDASLALIAKHIHNSDTEQAANERYRRSGPMLYSWPPQPDLAGLQMVLDFLPQKKKALKPAIFVNSSLLQDLQSHGECGGL